MSKIQCPLSVHLHFIRSEFRFLFLLSRLKVQPTPKSRSKSVQSDNTFLHVCLLFSKNLFIGIFLESKFVIFNSIILLIYVIFVFISYSILEFLSSSLFSRCGQNVSGLLDLKMRYVAAYLLAVLGGNKSPSKDDINKILSSVGIESDEDKMSKVINELKGKSIEDLISQGLD